MKTVKIKIPDKMDKDTAEFILNNKSFLLFKPEIRTEQICHNYPDKCSECEEPDCDSACRGLPFLKPKTFQLSETQRKGDNKNE